MNFTGSTREFGNTPNPPRKQELQEARIISHSEHAPNVLCKSKPHVGYVLGNYSHVQVDARCLVMPSAFLAAP